MRLTYKILWFEDDADIVTKTVGPRIEKYLESLGFECEFQHQLNGKDREQLVKEQNYDLILADLNLEDADLTGEKIIDDIRAYQVLTEVLLYSESDEAINKIVTRTGKVVERISFSAGRNNLQEKIQSIISLGIRKIQDVNNMRGLVIAQTIDLENTMTDMVLNYFSKGQPASTDASKQKIAKDIHDKKLEHHQKKLSDIQGINPPDVQKMMEKSILTAEDTYQAVMRIVKNKIAEIQTSHDKENGASEKQTLKENLDAATALRDVFKDFHAEILELRNVLAHVKEEKETSGIPYLQSIRTTGTPIRFDNAKYSEIRKTLKKHADNLKQMSSNLEGR